jgi:hypothetical protein
MRRRSCDGGGVDGEAELLVRGGNQVLGGGKDILGC